MNLQLLKHGIGKRRAGKAAGLAMAAWMAGMGFSAWAQVATRIQLSVENARSQTTLTAKVADVGGNPATDGTVSFETAKGSIGAAFVRQGTATLIVDKLPQGTRSVTAAYSGSEGFNSSASTTAAVAEASTLPDFSVTANPSSVSLSAGDYATVTITITPENGFVNMVTLSCSGNPATSTCIFNPVTVTPTSSAPVSSTLQIQTQASSGTSASLGSSSRASHIAYAVALPGILALLGSGALRRRSGFATLRTIGFLALLAAGTLGLGACSQRYSYLHHPPSGNPGTPAGTYTLTIAAYASNGSSVTSHTITLPLTVK